MDESRPNNIPEYGVADLAGAIRRTLEGAFGRLRLRGEITEMKRYPSGHIYLSLKDQDAKIEAVIWKGSLRNIGTMPENGVEMIATGRISTYADRSKYQLVIERLEYAGEGALLARIEALRKRLLEEGLFDESRKRPLPLLPRVIGVITSEKGAVIQDIRTTIARRFPRHILLWPVAVQGQGAAEQIAAAIRGFSALPAGGAVPRPDVLIVARGGGSLPNRLAGLGAVALRDATVVGQMVEVTVGFVARIATSDGEIETRDLWTFSRLAGNTDPAWVLIATDNEDDSDQMPPDHLGDASDNNA